MNIKRLFQIGLVFLALPVIGLADTKLLPAEDNVDRNPAEKNKESKKTKYFIEDTERIDAGTFHVAFAGGGNFYIEPKFGTNSEPLGTSFSDFGFQFGMYFDYDYLDTPLGLRAFIGYKYILSSVHVFDVEAIARYLMKFSEDVAFGIGVGVSSAVWFREITSTSFNEESIFLPSLIIAGGFDFNPFMTDLRLLVNRVGDNSTILGFELMFGFRL